MLNKIINFIKSLFPPLCYEYCYSDREREGIASMGCCCGVVGGTRNTEYLSEQCVSCPYLVLIEKENERA